MGQKRILVVEDEMFLRDVYVNTLRDEGYIVDEAKDGEEALAKIKGELWDLVLLDIRLPKLSGFEIMERLKSDPTYKRTTIVFLTNLDDETAIKDALSSFGNGYLIKSQITPGDLINEVKTYLQPEGAQPASLPSST